MSGTIDLQWEPIEVSYGIPRKDRVPFRYEAFLPDRIAALDPLLPARVLAAVEDAIGAVAELESSEYITDLEPIAPLLLRAESVASSRIEGLRLSHRRLEEATFAPKAAKSSAREIVRNIEAMRVAVQLGASDEAITLDSLLEIHRTLLHTDRDARIAGVLRTTQNWIGGSEFSPRGADFIPPPPSYVPDLMDDLLAFVNRDDLSAIVQAAVAHAQFETIHPFAEGNGRTGRCLIHVILRRRGVVKRVVPPISVVLAANSSRYIAGLSSCRRDEIDPWISVFAEATAASARQAQDLAREIAELQADWLRRAGRPRKGSTARGLIEGLVAHPLVSVSSASEVLGVSEEAARQALNQLAERGVVTQLTVGKRNRAWAAEEVFDLLDGFDMELGERGADAEEGRDLIR